MSRSPASLLIALLLLGCPKPSDSKDAGTAAPSDAGTISDAGNPDSGPGPSVSTWCALPGSVVYAAGGQKTVVPGSSAPDVSWVTVPPGFCVHWFGNVNNARQIRFAPGGEAFVASPTGSTTGGGPGGHAAILVLADDNHDGVADQPYTSFLTNLPQTQGMLFTSGKFYYQDATAFRRLDYTPGQRVSTVTGETIVNVSAPSYVSLLHWPRAIDVADDGTFYFTNGSDQGEVCYQARPFIGGVLKVDGSDGGTPVVKGLRNPIAIRCQRGHNECYGVEMGLDYAEAAGAREKVFRIHQGDDQGFPCCGTTNTPHSGVTAVGSSGAPPTTPDCSGVTAETVSLHIGRSPMGLDFEPGRWPAAWQRSLFMGFHGEFGTWIGCKVVAVAMDPVTGLPKPTSELAGGDASGISDFATGWDDGLRDHGRADDVSFSNDGRLFLTNDVTGEILWFAPVDLAIPGADGGMP